MEKVEKAEARASVPGPLSRVAFLRDEHVRSPKSAIFHPSGRMFYVNALEGMETLVYDAHSLKRLAIIRHVFGTQDSPLFRDGEETLFDYVYNSDAGAGRRNCFGGKPVESAFSHGGRYLWVTYYRRNYDHNASSPSAVAIIDTEKNEIVRVIPTGPLAKMIVPSPDGKTMAIIHWGDNSIGLIDISSEDPMQFSYKKLLVVGRRLPLRGISGDRDQQCGHCLRGATFTKDSRYLMVGRMHGGGITVFDLEDGTTLGTLESVAYTPRHLVLSPDGETLFVSSNSSGIVSSLKVSRLLQAVREAKGGSTRAYRGRELFVGHGARTLAVSPNGKRLYVACNRESKLVRVDVDAWKATGSIPVAPYAVGVAVSPDETLLVTTSQGRGGRGGDVVGVYRSGL
ncbi:MAG: peptidoglycan-binding protein [Deltaproteobacteria bacterium]|nr:peptidoglycan-binding protein [Deltaproteobacteria bacterium]